MTAFSPYQAYPGPAEVPAEPPPVLFAVADPGPQRRLTVLFRLILAVPHLFLLNWLNMAACFVLFIGWWGALFTGRLPQFAVTYLSGLLRWTSRVSAYHFLLTDVYPPFSFDDDPTYPVRVVIPEPQRLNPFTVFFLAIIAIPAGLLASIVTFGAYTLMAFIAWLTTLIAGQLPSSLHLAYVAVLRFQARFSAFYWMLTPVYPGGLYGDRPGMTAWAGQPPAAQVPGYGAPGSAWGNPAASAPQGYDAPQGYGAPLGYGGPQGYGAPLGYGAPGYGVPAAYGAPGGYGVRPPFQPATWLLPLTSAAKNLVTTFIVLGCVTLVGYYILIYTVAMGSAVGPADNTTTAINANNQLVSSYSTLSNSLTALQTASTNCKQNLPCVTKEDGKAASAFSTFSGQLANIAVPAGASAGKARLAAAAAASQQDFTQLSETTSVAQYQSTFASTQLQQTLNGFDADFNALTSNLQTY